MLNTQKIKVKKLNENAIIPTYGTQFSAGADVYALCDKTLSFAPNETILVKTGVAFEIPEGYAGFVFARSSLGYKKGLAPANKVGVIDSDYRGELMVPLHNHSSEIQEIQNGERIAQIIFMPYLKAEFFEEETLSDTVRGMGGFGSTGV